MTVALMINRIRQYFNNEEISEIIPQTRSNIIHHRNLKIWTYPEQQMKFSNNFILKTMNSIQSQINRLRSEESQLVNE